MSLPDFLAELRRREIQLWVDGDRLRCSGPVGVLTPELRDRMQQRKIEILEFLRAAEAVAQQQPAIVPLQPRGRHLPVFAVPGHNGDVFAFRAFAQQLGPDQPFFGLRPAGLDGRGTPIGRVEDLAAYFADQIVAVRPHGPVVVAGYCAGGSIAFELAQQLQRRGTPVASLAMFACPYPTMFRFTTVKLLPGRLAGRARALARLSSLAACRQYVADLVRPMRQALAGDESTGVETDDVSILRTRLERTTVAAVRRYVPRTFPGRVNLFLPSWTWARSPAKALRWRALAQQSEVYVGPEDCQWDRMLRPPSAHAIAELFARARDDQETQTALKPGA